MNKKFICSNLFLLRSYYVVIIILTMMSHFVARLGKDKVSIMLSLVCTRVLLSGFLETKGSSWTIKRRYINGQAGPLNVADLLVVNPALVLTFCVVLYCSHSA